MMMAAISTNKAKRKASRRGDVCITDIDDHESRQHEYNLGGKYVCMVAELYSPLD